MSGQPDNNAEDKNEGRSIKCNDGILKIIQDKSAGQQNTN